jgi:hypothetical protein
MLHDPYLAEEVHTVSVNKRSYSVYMVPFWLHNELYSRIYVNKEPGQLAVWDNNSSTLRLTQAESSVPEPVLNVLAEKISTLAMQKGKES